MKKWYVVILISVALICGSGLLISWHWQIGVTDHEYASLIKNGTKSFALEVPRKMTFCGEEVPLDVYWVKEALDRELITNTYWQSATLLALKRANRYFPQIEPYLLMNKVPDDMKYLALIESNLLPVVSPAGASGHWQFIKETGLHYGMEINDEVDERYNIEKSTIAACNYLKEAHTKFSSWTLAAAAYNAGPDNISKTLSLQGANNFYEAAFNPETSRYLFRILAMKEIFNNPRKYGFIYRAKDLYPNIPVKELKIDTPITNLSAFAKNQGLNYKILKEFNPWLRKNTLSNKTHKTYTISLPEKEDIYYSKLLQNKELFGVREIDTI
ncbi:MAG: lytic transglycosylase domain-containing protein [Bacteroidota bacterium]